ncbi:MAG: CDP-diacylglycerol--serine O-phosphatidyltransferase [Bacteroidales bacterium]
MKLFTVPNLITLLGLSSGCIAIVFSLTGDLATALVCIIIAAILDFCDGFAARLLNSYSKIGKELDSLADLVSFGVAPAAMLFFILSAHTSIWIAVCPILLVLASALRLAKFNVDERQTESFLGLPTPANALFFSSLALLYKDLSTISTFATPYIMVALIVVFSYLLISEVPMFSLKMKQFALKKYYLQVLFLVLSLGLLVFVQIVAVPLIIGLYIILSLIAKR